MTRARPAIFEIRVALDDVRDCQRLIRVSAGATLARAHRVLATAFGWPTSGRYAFWSDHVRYDGEWSSQSDERDIRHVRLRQLLPDVGARLGWECGSRAEWSATLSLHGVFSPDTLLPTPACVGGVGQPPAFEDGPWAGWDQSGRVDFTPTIVNAELALLRSGRRD